MKKYLYLSVALLTTLSLGACGDDDEPGSGSAANVQFSASSYTLDDEPIEIKVVASQAAASNLNIGFTVGGTATTADYELSAQSFLLEAGKTEATVTVTPKQAYKEAKTLTFNLAAGKGYVIGRVASTTVNLVESSVYVYSFTTAAAELQESLDVTLTVGDENFKAPKDLELPFKVLSGSTSELGKHFLVKDEATSFIVPKDGNTATLTLLPGPDADLANPATLKLGVDEQGGRFVAGETASVTVTVKGLLSYAALAGTWHCKELIGLEMLELFAMDEDLDTSKVPSNNDDFTITITAGSESAKFTPSSTGDLASKPSSWHPRCGHSSSLPRLAVLTPDEQPVWHLAFRSLLGGRAGALCLCLPEDFSTHLAVRSAPAGKKISRTRQAHPGSSSRDIFGPG